MAKQVLTFPRDRQRRDRDDERRFAVDAVGSPRERTNEQERNRKQEKKRERRTVKIRKKNERMAATIGVVGEERVKVKT